jgi:hypothetical protein
MRISNDTITILKNLATINPAIFLSAGSTIKSRAEAGNIHVEVTLEEEFPIDCPIWDLPSLISMLTLFPEAEVEFGEHSLSISKDDNEFQFYYADSEIVKEVKNKIPKYDALFECRLTVSDIQTINKTAGILKASSISFICDGTKVYLVVGDETVSTKNSYNKLVGECDTRFAYHIDRQSFKLIDDEYKVSVSKSPKFVHFASESMSLDYAIAVKANSTLD